MRQSVPFVAVLLVAFGGPSSAQHDVVDRLAPPFAGLKRNMRFSQTPCQKRADQLPAQPSEKAADWGASLCLEDFTAEVCRANGELRLRVTDLVVPSRGFPFVWARTYTSRSRFDHGLGHNWDFAYNRRVCLLPSGNVTVVDGWGREDPYVDLGGGSYRSPRGVFDTLVRNGNGTFTQTHADGMQFHFDPDGYLASMVDRAGNTLTIQRNAFHNITQITDTQGRLYAVTYTTAGPDQRIQTVSDFSTPPRELRYEYDGNGDLVSCRSPLVVGTPNGNDYPLGKTTLYAYSSDSATRR